MAVSTNNVWPGVIHDVRPTVFAALASIYAALWFTTPVLGVSVLLSFVFIFVARMQPTAQRTVLPPYPDPRTRRELLLVLEEQHHRLTVGRASVPRW